MKRRQETIEDLEYAARTVLPSLWPPRPPQPDGPPKPFFSGPQLIALSIAWGGLGLALLLLYLGGHF